MLPISQPNKALADNLNALLDTYPSKMPRPKMAARMGIGDKTLGFLKSGTGNPTLDIVDKVARFFRKEPWELLKPADDDVIRSIAGLANLATPRSRAALQTIQEAAERGDLTEPDLQLLQHIAQRFMGK